jgi:hypothetical protein
MVNDTPARQWARKRNFYLRCLSGCRGLPGPEDYGLDDPFLVARCDILKIVYDDMIDHIKLCHPNYEDSLTYLNFLDEGA